MPRITSIRKLAPQMTVDVEVEDTHSYQLDNGWVSHNTVSQLVDSASGIHPRHSRWYVRRARMDVKDPLVGLMKSAGFRVEPDVMKPEHTVVVSFPIEAPKNAVFRGDVDAIQHLELWKVYRDHWCDHNPSITVTVRKNVARLTVGTGGARYAKFFIGYSSRQPARPILPTHETGSSAGWLDDWLQRLADGWMRALDG